MVIPLFLFVYMYPMVKHDIFEIPWKTIVPWYMYVQSFSTTVCIKVP